MTRTAEGIARDIRALKVQGARRVAQAALGALVLTARKSRAKTKSALYDDLLKTARMLKNTRPTEPMMRNALEDSLRFGLAWIRTHKKEEPKETKKELKESLSQVRISVIAGNNSFAAGRKLSLYTYLENYSE